MCDRHQNTSSSKRLSTIIFIIIFSNHLHSDFSPILTKYEYRSEFSTGMANEGLRLRQIVGIGRTYSGFRRDWEAGMACGMGQKAAICRVVMWEWRWPKRAVRPGEFALFRRLAGKTISTAGSPHQADAIWGGGTFAGISGWLSGKTRAATSAGVAATASASACSSGVP